jgi:2-iminobutanoate/2-iminopropanoate deaminase
MPSLELIDVPGLPAGPWHWASSVGNLVFTSGCVPIDEDGEMGDDVSATAQAELAFSNMQRQLEAGGSSMDRIVKVIAFLTDPATLADIRAVRDRWLTTAPPSTFVFVSALVDPRWLIEIEAIGVKA